MVFFYQAHKRVLGKDTKQLHIYKILVTCNICRKFKIHGQIKGLFAYCCFISEMVLRSISTIKKIELELFTSILGEKEKVNCVCCKTSPLQYLLDSCLLLNIFPCIV